MKRFNDLCKELAELESEEECQKKKEQHRQQTEETIPPEKNTPTVGYRKPDYQTRYVRPEKSSQHSPLKTENREFHEKNLRNFSHEESSSEASLSSLGVASSSGGFSEGRIPDLKPRGNRLSDEVRDERYKHTRSSLLESAGFTERDKREKPRSQPRNQPENWKRPTTTDVYTPEVQPIVKTSSSSSDPLQELRSRWSQMSEKQKAFWVILNPWFIGMLVFLFFLIILPIMKPPFIRKKKTEQQMDFEPVSLDWVAIIGISGLAGSIIPITTVIWSQIERLVAKAKIAKSPLHDRI